MKNQKAQEGVKRIHMKAKTIIAKILKSIPIALIIASFGASIYAAKVNLITGYSSSVILGIIVLLYFLGIFLDRKETYNA